MPPLTHVPKCQGHEGVMRAGPGTFALLNLIELPWPISPDCPHYSAEPSRPLADQHSSPAWCYLGTYWKCTLLPRLVESDDSRGPSQPHILWFPPSRSLIWMTGMSAPWWWVASKLNKCDDGCCETGLCEEAIIWMKCSSCLGNERTSSSATRGWAGGCWQYSKFLKQCHQTFL